VGAASTNGETRQTRSLLYASLTARTKTTSRHASLTCSPPSLS
jgi:hypothetical protein